MQVLQRIKVFFASNNSYFHLCPTQMRKLIPHQWPIKRKVYNWTSPSFACKAGAEIPCQLNHFCFYICTFNTEIAHKYNLNWQKKPQRGGFCIVSIMQVLSWCCWSFPLTLPWGKKKQREKSIIFYLLRYFFSYWESKMPDLSVRSLKALVREVSW